jgi:transcription antitermination factor NusG
LLTSAISSASSDFLSAVPVQFPWYAVRTRSNFERTASAVLAAKGYKQYLPLYRLKKRWSDRVVTTELPLFPGYVFCRFDAKKRTPILSTPGVFAIVGFGAEAAPIPDHEVEAIERVLDSGLAAGPCPFLREGQRIRIKQGPLENVEGILLKKKSEWRMVVSVPMLQRSVSVEIDADWIMAA